MFSNKYIYIYTTIMVVVVAALLALASIFLQPFQASNIEIEKMQNILSAAGIPSTSENAKSLYKESVVEELSVNSKGELVAKYNSTGELLEGSGQRAFDIDMKKALSMGQEGIFPVFIYNKDGKNLCIVPLQGKGLWGAIWGYISFASDMNTIVGAKFDHKGETPGLGAEISTDIFQKEFDGKQIFDEQNKFTSITVQKGGVRNYKGDPIHAVDAISGGTITSAGVSDMLRDCLLHYLPYFEKTKIAFANEIEGISTDSVVADSNAVELPMSRKDTTEL